MKTLADFQAFRIDGPTLVIVRPQKQMTEAMAQSFEHFTRHFEVPNVKFMLMPHDWDVMAVGEAEAIETGIVEIDAPKA